MNRNLAYALSKLDELGNRLEVTDKVKIEATRVYTSAVEHRVLNGRSIEVVIASSLYLGCRLAHAPFSVSEISNICNVKDKNVVKGYKIIAKELHIKVPVINPKDYLERYSLLLELPVEVTDKAEAIVLDAEEDGLIGGKSPTVVAGSSLYLAGLICGEKRTQIDISTVAGVSDVAIRKCCKILREGLDLDI